MLTFAPEHAIVYVSNWVQASSPSLTPAFKPQPCLLVCSVLMLQVYHSRIGMHAAMS